MAENERRKKTQGAHAGIQGEGRVGGGTRGEDGQRDCADIWSASGAGRAVEEGDSGEGRRVFEVKRGPKPVDENSSEDRLYGEIGRLKMEVDWLKKKLGE